MGTTDYGARGMGSKNKNRVAEPASKVNRSGFSLPVILSLGVVFIAIAAGMYGKYFAEGLGSMANATSPATAQQPADAAKKPKSARKKKRTSSVGDDTDENCAAWARDGECERNAAFMAGACAKSCSGKLPGSSKEEELAKLPDGAVDKDDNCPAWAASGECEKNSGYMADACARSCAGQLGQQQRGGQQQQQQQRGTAKKEVKSIAVDWSPPTLPAELAAAQAEADAEREATRAKYGGRMWPGQACEDMRPDCATLARWNLSACGESEVMLTRCPRTCRTCHYHDLVAGISECADTHEQCASWARSGECEKNRRFMLSGCSKSCGVCESKIVGCSRRNPTPGVRAPDGLTRMFERALVDFPQFSPTALSTPKAPVEGGPYILQFEDLISAEEAKVMISLAGDKLERSLAGDQLSPVRTSTQYWCDDSDDCTQHPVVLKITERMMNITGMPVDHAEYFQILRYEKGQFYRQHHDQQTAHWTPQGVRVYTFFVYLSDVEEGGGTKFNDLGLVVRPKLGRAILWPSVQAKDLLTGERRTHHEALPVEKGIKYAANLWIHLYDFKTPSRAGICPFLGQNTHGGD